MLLFTIVLGSLVACMLYKVKFSRRDLARSTFPQPRSLPLLHNSLEFISVKSHEVMKKFMQWHDELGEVFLFVKSPFDCGTVVVSDPVIAEVLSFHQPDRSRSSSYNFLSQWIGKDTLFLSSGNRLKQKQKIALVMLKPKYFPKVTSTWQFW
jgi:hypothetical protein